MASKRATPTVSVTAKRGDGRDYSRFVPALAAVLGALVAGGASYFATQTSNHAAERRELRTTRVEARAAARVVREELNRIRAEAELLGTGRADLIGQKTPYSTGIRFTLQDFEPREWPANRFALARSLKNGEWKPVANVYQRLETVQQILRNTVSTQGGTYNVATATIRNQFRKIAQKSKTALGVLDRSMRNAPG